jgi:hypothetical protein
LQSMVYRHMMVEKPGFVSTTLQMDV